MRNINARAGITHPIPVRVDTTGVDFNDILRKFGTFAQGHVDEKHLPLNTDFMSVACQYDKISFDEYGAVFDRALMVESYRENPDYVQIGLTDGQDPVLIKRHSEDPMVYIINIDEGSLSIPEECFESFKAYIISEYKYFMESLEEENKRKIKS